MKSLVLTVEQMQYLQELRVSLKHASMAWFRMTTDSSGNEIQGSWFLGKNEPLIIQNFETYEMIPTFTLQDIIDTLPKEIYGVDRTYKTLYIDFANEVMFYGVSTDNDYEVYKKVKIIDNDLLNAAYALLCWFLQIKEMTRICV